MNDIIYKIKLKNKESIKKSSRILIYLEILFIIVGISILIIDAQKFMTVSVFLIFFSLVMGIVSLFFAVVKISKKISIKIANSVDFGYSVFINRYNLMNNTDYNIKSDAQTDEELILVPSFSNKSVNYLIESQKTKLYHCSVFNTSGSQQSRTYYFKGLYLIIKGVKGDMQFRTKESISGILIETLKPLYHSDAFDISNYKYKKQYKDGMLYNNYSERPELLDAIINHLQNIDYIKSFRIGMKNNELHIAITQNSMRLPYVKKYIEIEIKEIEKIVNENLDLIQSIRELM